MEVMDPGAAQQIVAEYARMLERHAAEDVYPVPVTELPYPKPTIRAAIEQSVRTLSSMGQLSDELRDYLEIAYVSLADYVDMEVVTLMREHRRAAERLAIEGLPVNERVSSPAWTRMAETSRLAGEIAKAIADESQELRSEFQLFLSPSGS